MRTAAKVLRRAFAADRIAVCMGMDTTRHSQAEISSGDAKRPAR
jgi:hypothetical protein